MWPGFPFGLPYSSLNGEWWLLCNGFRWIPKFAYPTPPKALIAPSVPTLSTTAKLVRRPAPDRPPPTLPADGTLEVPAQAWPFGAQGRFDRAELVAVRESHSALPPPPRVVPYVDEYGRWAANPYMPSAVVGIGGG